MMVQVLRFIVRAFSRDRSTAGIATLTFGVGIGLTAMMFSIINGVLFRGLPFEDGKRIVYVETRRGGDRPGLRVHDFAEWRARNQSFDGLAAWRWEWFDLSGGEGPAARYAGAHVTPEMFPLLGVTAAHGRVITPADAEPGAVPVVVISDIVWRDRFDRRADAVGSSLRLNGVTRVVVGVMRPGFAFPVMEQLWTPLNVDPFGVARGEGPTFSAAGRLRAGTTIADAQRDLDRIAGSLADQYPDTNEDLRAWVEPFVNRIYGEELVSLAWTMLAAVFGVLVVACVNVANIILARAVARVRDTAVRVTLGASRLRVVGRLLGEVLVLATAGALIGLAVARVGVVYFDGVIRASPRVPFWVNIEMDAAAFLVVLLLTGFTALVAGVIPSVQALRVQPGEILKDAARGSTGFRVGRVSRALVVAEVALSAALLVGAGVATRSVTEVRRMTVAFAADDLVAARYVLPSSTYPDGESRREFIDRLQRRLASNPVTSRSAVTSSLPGLGAPGTSLQIEGETYVNDADYPYARWAAVSPGYFDVLDAPVISGVDFGSADDDDAERVVIVNESFVRQYLRGSDALGRRVRFGRNDQEQPWRTIVGVVPDLGLNGRRGTGLLDESPVGLYLPIAQSSPGGAALVTRSPRPGPAAQALRSEVDALDPDIALFDIQPLRDAIDGENTIYLFFGDLFFLLGSVALGIAGVGLYGVVAFTVRQRTGEIGLRMAMGAATPQVLKWVGGRIGLELTLGAVLGLAMGLGLSRLLSTVLFKVDTADAAALLSTVAVLVAAGIAAAAGPALRATRVDPAVALRQE